MNLESIVQIGDFKVERRLGAGGMGIVYLARQLSLNRLVALKVLGSALTEQTDIARFQREAQAIAKLDHPGIAGVYFVGQDRHICYIAMEYIDGISLRQLMKTLTSPANQHRSIDEVLQATSPGEEAPELRYDGPTQSHHSEPPTDDQAISPDVTAHSVKRLLCSPDYIRRCCEIIRDMSIALAHAHERGVIHRDLKPENILLDRHGKPHLIDFGLARFYEDVTLTNTGALVGTPMYMSPEQVTGRLKIDHRTDIYSLGVVLYEMLTLGKPFTSPTREGILRQIVTKAMVPVGWKNTAVPRDLESVVHTATAKDPDERYQSATDLGSDLQNSLTKKPINARTYKYSLNFSDVNATRPWPVTVIAFLFFSLGLWFSLVTLSYVIPYSLLRSLEFLGITKFSSFYMLDLDGTQMRIWLVLAIMMFVSCFAIVKCFKRTILYIMICILTVGIISLISITQLYLRFYWASNKKMYESIIFTFALDYEAFFYILNLSAIFICFYVLRHRSVIEWFDQVDRLRSEYKRRA